MIALAAVQAGFVAGQEWKLRGKVQVRENEPRDDYGK